MGWGSCATLRPPGGAGPSSACLRAPWTGGCRGAARGRVAASASSAGRCISARSRSGVGCVVRCTQWRCKRGSPRYGIRRSRAARARAAAAAVAFDMLNLDIVCLKNFVLLPNPYSSLRYAGCLYRRRPPPAPRAQPLCSDVPGGRGLLLGAHCEDLVGGAGLGRRCWELRASGCYFLNARPSGWPWQAAHLRPRRR